MPYFAPIRMEIRPLSFYGHNWYGLRVSILLYSQDISTVLSHISILNQMLAQRC
jgi:hypothetical protein